MLQLGVRQGMPQVGKGDDEPANLQASNLRQAFLPHDEQGKPLGWFTAKFRYDSLHSET